MADDPERDVYPTKEGKEKISEFEIHVPERHIPIERRTGQHFSRSDLEDQFYKFKEENLQLKKATKKQEDELKRLATKMSRLLRERKSMELLNSPGRKRDLELEEMVEDLQDKVRLLEKTNSHLREKMLVAKQQVIMQVRRPNPYSHVPPKVNTGTSRTGVSPYFLSVNAKGKSPQNLNRKPPAIPIPPYAISLLEEARNELSNLKMLMSNQKSELELYEQENELLKQKLRMREIEFDEELNALKSQLTQRQRQHVQENLDLIRLHRELKQKNTKFLSLQAQYADLEEKMHVLKLNHDHLVKDMDDLASRYKVEQKRNLELLGELQKAEITFASTAELQEKIKTVQKENEILRETNDKLIKSTLAVEKERAINQMEEIWKEKISNLELTLQTEMKDKNAIEQELNKEKEIFALKEEAHIQLKEHFNQMKSHLGELEAKVIALKAQNVDVEEIGEALNLLQLKKENKLNFNSDLTQNEIEDLRCSLQKSESDHIETMKELHNVREMLMTQYAVNEASQKEVKSLAEKIEQQEREFFTKIEEFSHLLDIRAARIQKLEKQLNDIAYGTKSYSITTDELDDGALQPENLSRGENIFEIHIVKVDFNTDGQKKLMSNPNIFITWNFYEFELQSTTVVSAEKPNFNFTAQYKVQVDDYFLCYLHESSVTLELHESFGLDYKTIATCELHFSDIITKSLTRLHGTQQLFGISEEYSLVLGTVEYWARLKVPIAETFKLFKEKLKALKYIHKNQEVISTAVNFLRPAVNSTGRDSHVNELHIKVIRGNNLSSRQKALQPSTFCVYKFYDLPEQDTILIPASNNPEYSDHRTFSLFLDCDLEKYLRTENLYIYVFDDNDPDITSYIGRAEVPLQPLCQNQSVKGIFELKKEKAAESAGSIEILIYWQYDYIPCLSGSDTFVQEKMTETEQSKAEESLSSDCDIGGSGALLQYSSPVQPPIPKPRRSIPTRPMNSTPVKKQRDSSPDSDAPVFSPKMSPIHKESYSFTPKHAELDKHILDDNATVSQQLQSELDADEEDMMKDKEEILTGESSDEDSHNFSDEDSDQFEATKGIQSPQREKYPEQKFQASSIKVLISHLILNENASVLFDETIKMLYVEYQFLDYPLEELETISVPKAEASEKIKFEYEKVFTLNSTDVEKWNLLNKIMTTKSQESSLIKFTVVSEPPSDDKDLECEDIGYGFVDLNEILRNNQDMVSEYILIYDAQEDDTKIGKLNVTVLALNALMQLRNITDS